MASTRTLALLVLLALPACGPRAAVSGAGGAALAQQATDVDFGPLPAPSPISREEYAARRDALVQQIGDGVLLVIGSFEPALDYLPYAQTAGFRYLTGVVEPGAALLITRRGGEVAQQLFVMPRDPSREVWEGARLGTEGAERLTGLPARTNDELVPAVQEALRQGGPLFTLTAPGNEDAGEGFLTPEQQLVARIARDNPTVRIVPVNDQVARLRATKSPAELDLIRRAVLISVLAHRAAMQSVEPGMNEFEIQALVEYFFRRNGAERPAYSSIVGSGPNSTTLHYRDADRFMQAGEVLLMDVGASFRGYAADVTRTMPVNGRFSAEQRAIYEIVLQAQTAAEALVRPGATWAQLNAAADRVIAEGLARLRLIDSPTATYDCASPQLGNTCPQFRLFYMHGLGHGVGLDVHDPDISYYGAFAPGSAFTIEPGIYVRADAFDYLPDTPGNRSMIQRLRPALERHRHIGVRIEDVYLVTEAGVERPSRFIPREIDEIEALMARTGAGQLDRRPDVVEWFRATEPR